MLVQLNKCTVSGMVFGTLLRCLLLRVCADYGGVNVQVFFD